MNRLKHANEQLLNCVADKKHLPMFQTGVFASTPHWQKTLPSGNKTKRYKSEVLSETNQIEGANFNIKLVGGFNPIEKYIGSFPQLKVNNNKYLKPPPSKVQVNPHSPFAICLRPPFFFAHAGEPVIQHDPTESSGGLPRWWLYMIYVETNESYRKCGKHILDIKTLEPNLDFS